MRRTGHGKITTLRSLMAEDRLPGGAADDRLPSDFDANMLAFGSDDEMEHTDNPEIAEEIAMDHLADDPGYYVEGSLRKEQVRKIIEARLQRLQERGAYLPPTDDVLRKAKEDLNAIREKLPSMTQILVDDIVTMELEALGRAIGFKGIGRMKKLSARLKMLAMEYKAESYELASTLAVLAKEMAKESDKGIKELERSRKDAGNSNKDD